MLKLLELSTNIMYFSSKCNLCKEIYVYCFTAQVLIVVNIGPRRQVFFTWKGHKNVPSMY